MNFVLMAFSKKMLKPAYYRFFILFVFFVVFIVSCTSPKKWKNSPYISGDTKGFSIPRGTWSIPDFRPGIIVPESNQIVRVLLYTGKPLPVSAKQYKYKTQTGKTIRGKGKMTPRTSGEFISKGPFYLKGKPYAGKLRVRVMKRKVAYINVVSEYEYLVSVVSHEMNPSWPIEALKAQAVVARTYLYHKKKSSGYYDVDSTTRHQVYKGMRKKDENVRKAVKVSSGQVVTYNNQLAQVFFYSCAGGYTAAASEVWTADFPYLVAQKSDFCKGAPVYRWRTRYTKKEIESRLRLRHIQKIIVAKRSQSRRAKTIAIKTKRGMHKLSGNDFRKKLGNNRVKSTLFGIRIRGKYIEIAGKGYGHGVGMDQWGSRFLAEKYRRNYKDIISHYFPGTKIRVSHRESSST